MLNEDPKAATRGPELTPDPNIHLDDFLDDDFLKGEKVDDSPIERTACSTTRGASGRRWLSK